MNRLIVDGASFLPLMVKGVMKARTSVFAALLVSAAVLSTEVSQASDILWSSATGSAWLTGTNWTGGSAPSATDNAQFGVNPTSAATGVGINMNGATNNGAKNQAVGSIEITNARSNSMIIGNSSTTVGADGTLTINGATVNSVNNVILRSSATGGTLTIQNTQSTGNRTMSVTLTNATDNVVVIDGAGSISVNSALASAAVSHVTLQGSGSGMFKIWPGLASMPDSVAITGTSLGFGVNAGGTGEWTGGSDPNTVGTLAALIDGRNAVGTTNQIFWNSGNTFGIDTSNATGGTVTYSGVIGSFRTGPNPADTTNNIGFTKLGTGTTPGTLVLSGVSTYTGNTTILGGTLQLGVDNALPTTTLLVNTSGNTFDLNGFNQTVKSISGAGPIKTGSTGTLTINNPSGESYSGLFTVVNGGTIIKNGSGSLLLSSNNDQATGFEGNFILNNGSISVGANGVFGGNTSSPGATNTITINGGTLSNLNSTGRTMNANVAITGNYTVDNTLTTGGSGVPGSLSFASRPATIKTPNLVITVAFGDYNGFTGVNVTSNMHSLGALGQDVAGRSLTKAGNGILTLSGDNSYTGDTTVTDGALMISSGPTNPYTGQFFVQGGRLQLNATSSLGAGNGTVYLSGGALVATQSRSGAGSIVINPVNMTASSSITCSSATAATPIFEFSGALTGAAGQTLSFRDDGAAATQFKPRFTGSFTFDGNMDLQTGTGALAAKTQFESFNSGATTQTFTGKITGPGSFNRAAVTIGTGGTTVFTGNLNDYAGGTSLNDGTLLVNNTGGSGTGSGEVNVNNGGKFGGKGSVDGLVKVNNLGAVAPGNPGINNGIDTLTMKGGMTLFEGGILNFDVGGLGNNDKIDLQSGALTLPATNSPSNAFVNITNAGGLTSGTYTLIDYGTNAGGSLSNVTVAGPGPFTYALNDNIGATRIELIVSAATTGGDYNGDTFVNAADYVTWRKDTTNGGGDPQGYITWRENFMPSPVAGPGLEGPAAVPEPSSIVLVALVGIGLFCGRRRVV